MNINISLGVTGNILGMTTESLIFGFIGGIVFLMFSEKMTRKQSLTTVLTSTILAGILTPLLLNLIQEESNFSIELLKGLTPFLIGVGWRYCLPYIKSIIQNWIISKFERLKGK